MRIFIFGNGNTSFHHFIENYEKPLSTLKYDPTIHFILCDFRGVDILAMELLKTQTPHVTIYHMGDKARYIPDKYKTMVDQWQFIGGFKTDLERDNAAIDNCTHFLAIDFNSDEARKSGTQKNIERCLSFGKINVLYLPMIIEHFNKN